MKQNSPQLALAALSLSMLLPSLGVSIANIALPALAQSFGAPFAEVQWVVMSFLLAMSATLVGFGRLGDAMGRGRLVMAGMLVYVAGSVLCALAPTLALLVAARAVQGLGAAAMMALTVALAAETVPPRRVGSAMGLLATMSAAGTALGPTLGGMLIEWFGWRGIFLVNIPLGLLAFGMAFVSLPRQGPQQRAQATDAPAPTPWFPLAILRDAQRRAGLALNTLVACVLMGTLVVGPFYLTAGLGLTAAAAGLAMSAGPLVAVLAGLPAGRLVDRFGDRAMTKAGLYTMVAGAGALALPPLADGVLAYVGPLVVLTTGYALFQAANNTAVMAGAAQHQRGVVAGVLTLSRNIGLIAGASLIGALFAHGAGAADVTTAAPGAVGAGMRLAYALSALVLLAAILIARAAARAQLRDLLGTSSQN